jgi:hypothetical protein
MLLGDLSVRRAPSAGRGIERRDRPFVEPALEGGHVEEYATGEFDMGETVVLHPPMQSLVGDLEILLDLLLG